MCASCVIIISLVVFHRAKLFLHHVHVCPVESTQDEHNKGAIKNQFTLSSPAKASRFLLGCHATVKVGA